MNFTEAKEILIGNGFKLHNVPQCYATRGDYTSPIRPDVPNVWDMILQDVIRDDEITLWNDKHNIFKRAIDNALISRCLDPTDECETVGDVLEKLNILCGWDVQVATDPKVNGGYRLVKENN